MSLDANATFVVGGGNYFIAEVGTAAPANPLEPGAGWTNIGHTSLEEILAFGSEGGEQTVLGTLQNRSLRTRYSDRTESWNLNLQQWDEDSLKLYFGSNAIELPDGSLAPHVEPQPTQKAFLAVFTDGPFYTYIHAPKVEIFRGEDIDLSDTESLNSLPLQITPLVHGTNKYTYSILPLTKVDDGEGGEVPEEG